MDLPGRSERRGSGRSTEGKVIECLPNAMFVVELDNGSKITTHISGSVRTRLVRVVPGERVAIEISPYDLTRGRIVRRIK